MRGLKKPMANAIYVALITAIHQVTKYEICGNWFDWRYHYY